MLIAKGYTCPRLPVDLQFTAGAASARPAGGNVVRTWELLKNYHLPYLEYRRLHDRAYRAQQRDHGEVCGVLATDPKGRFKLFFLRNESNHPASFGLQESTVDDTRRKVRETGLEAIGIFHSHSVGEAVLGPRDLRLAKARSLQLVYDVCGWEAKLWKIFQRNGRRRATELGLSVERTRRKRPA